MCFFFDLSQLQDFMLTLVRKAHVFSRLEYLGSISAVFSRPVFDPAGSFSRTAAGNRAYFLLKKSTRKELVTNFAIFVILFLAE